MSSNILSHMSRPSSSSYIPQETSVHDASEITFTSIQVFNDILFLLPWLFHFLWHRPCKLLETITDWSLSSMYSVIISLTNGTVEDKMASPHTVGKCSLKI